MQLHIALVGVAAIALTGCPDPEGTGGSALVGTWDEVAQPGEDAGFVTFRADGTFELVDDEPATGTFTADAFTLTMTSSTGDVSEVPYAVDGDRFTPLALRRDGFAAGFAGEWRAEGSTNGEVQVIELVLGADNTFQLDFGEDVLGGTWRDEGGELVTTVQVPTDGGQTVDVDLPWHSVDDAVTLLLFERR